MSQGPNYSSIFAGNVQISDGPSLDAFSRLRVSNSYTLFDSKQIYDANPLFWDDQQTSGSGTTSAHSVNTASSTLSVGATTAGTRVRQTFRRFNYQPGKSQLIFMTGTIGTAVSGITRRVGLFDENNGLFFEQTGSAFNVVRRTKASGSVVDVPVAQTAWNLDKMDGSGPSGIILLLDRTQIFIIDYEWLGVGRVRYGVVIAGLIIYVHQRLNANILDVPYMSTPNLPLRYEISNDGTAAASSLVHICTTVISEGGQENTGLVLSAATGNTSITAASAGTLYPIIGMRLKTTHFGATIKTESMSIMGSSTNDPIQWVLLLNPTVTGTFTYADLTNSACQLAYGAAATTATGGTMLNAGVLYSQSSQYNDLKNALALGSTIAGVADTIVLCVMPIAAAANAVVNATITWRELQ